MAKLKTLEARVLTEIAALGVDARHVIVGAAAHIKSLADAGLVDAAPAAVAYAIGNGAEIKDVTDQAGAFAAELDAFEESNGVDPDAAVAPAPAPVPAPAPAPAPGGDEGAQ